MANYLYILVTIVLVGIVNHIANLYADRAKKRYESAVDRHIELLEKRAMGCLRHFRWLTLLFAYFPGNRSTPTEVPQKIPAESVQLTAGTMRVGEKAVFRPDAMEYDPDGNAWINPNSIPTPYSPSERLATLRGDPLLQLERLSNGFKVDLRAARDIRWTPEPKEKLSGWIQVSEWV